MRSSSNSVENMPMVPRFLHSQNRLKDLLLLFSTLVIFYLIFHLHHLHTPKTNFIPNTDYTPTTPPRSTNLSLSHLFFSIAAASSSFSLRLPYINLWYKPNSTSAVIFLDTPISTTLSVSSPPILVSSDTSKFPYSFPSGRRSAIRIARIIKDTFDLAKNVNFSNTRWFIFGDDDTVFCTENLVIVLSKYDFEKWYYVGYNSESYEQNEKYSFDMAFGGGGFALSAPLAKVLAGVLDSCLMRYPHLYGSDSRVFSCLAELGVRLTHEPGFHQVDVRGDLFGILSAHPLSPLLSLHHLDAVEPLFPGMTRIAATEHLFQAVHADPARILQQTVCYDKSNLLTVSVAWGYAVQVFEVNQLLPDLLSRQPTFRPWKRGKSVAAKYMFNTRVFPSDPCKSPVVFFLQNVFSSGDGIWTEYRRHDIGNCVRSNPTKKLAKIRVFSRKLAFDAEQLKAPRRSCCDISSPINETMIIGIRQCGYDELISMQT
ncbi:PREDICTED: uncharacterized protein LOC109229496 [Nicotiana attenuata]|uniref:Uncharacterized protein n=1 Tax=Nicotiana attenuata TaxID=49451 RepID=A0A1J6J1L1_NICAT|nr:PREDICTED: uncharacterized protein LOC109229496 [Nicotiana attenuata]XP_019250501.1 PREDICTED: uncharacterized protein LOC109229496 [Nicotiana attenuata]OIT01177.1 hypothetical protein A4A49_10409 [Nicotiana attenuata]